jgi:hypothetical protein
MMSNRFPLPPLPPGEAYEGGYDANAMRSYAISAREPLLKKIEWIQKFGRWTDRRQAIVERLQAAEHKLSAIRSVVNEQAEDTGLWFDAVYATEAYLQQKLRRLHAVIEEQMK